MISTKEAHPPVRALVVVRTGASTVEITSPAKRANWIWKSLTDGSRSRQFGIGTRPLSPGKRANRTWDSSFRLRESQWHRNCRRKHARRWHPAGTSARVAFLRFGNGFWMTLTTNRVNCGQAQMRWHIPQAHS
jgi:hypothetical protein